MKTNLRFNIDQTVNIQADIELGSRYVVSIFDERGNCMVERLGLARYRNVRGAIATIMGDPRIVSVTTQCGVEVGRGYKPE
ncbi:TPA: hypothetical protein SH447_004537 [Salmonella enterica]|jgi:hypothetical protein|uniref:hypothetical protein n=1 Tax=Bacteria TaxID=2 RepID=UPI0025B454EB|nr:MULTISPECIES: hypothetical protein [Enterococcus]ELG7156352.1 hypothetical protein [Staphylococcus aureus]HDH7443097.1 hypothetical protein [Escherichia coli]HEH8886021.1 hypothetical protein [Salmonella enterica]MDN3040511.1 hypothetical protein [Enterococcus faecium]MDN3079987.1 hypothetical protein [Enterococcus faecium]